MTERAQQPDLTGLTRRFAERARQSKFGNTIAPGNMGIALMPRLENQEKPWLTGIKVGRFFYD